jgi:hypothetical protein
MHCWVIYVNLFPTTSSHFPMRGISDQTHFIISSLHAEHKCGMPDRKKQESAFILLISIHHHGRMSKCGDSKQWRRIEGVCRIAGWLMSCKWKGRWWNEKSHLSHHCGTTRMWEMMPTIRCTTYHNVPWPNFRTNKYYPGHRGIHHVCGIISWLTCGCCWSSHSWLFLWWVMSLKIWCRSIFHFILRIMSWKWTMYNCLASLQPNKLSTKTRYFLQA